jgi:hypothetical protein
MDDNLETDLLTEQYHCKESLAQSMFGPINSHASQLQLP